MNDSRPTQEATEGTPAWQPRRDPLVWLILGVYFVVAVASSFVHELGYAPDETSRHYPYMEWLGEEYRLPEADPDAVSGALELHPPLYYVALLPVYKAAVPFGRRAALRALRLTAPFIVGATLLLWFAVIRRACGDDRRTSLFTLALTAWWPNLQVQSATFNNDTGALLISAGVLYLVAAKHWESKSLGSAALWGLLIGLGGLVKASVPVGTAPVVLVGLMYQHGRRFWADKRFWARLGMAALVTVVVCGWWYVRSTLLHGSASGISKEMGYAPIPEGMSVLDAWSEGYIQMLTYGAIVGLWKSAWAGVVWFPSEVVGAVYRVLLALTIAASVGIAIRGIRRRRGAAPLPALRSAAIVLPAVGLGTILLSDMYVAVFVHQGFMEGGRYLMPFLVGLTIPFALGLKQVIPARAQTPFMVVSSLFFLCLNFLIWYHIWNYWNPYVLVHAGPWQ